MADQTIPPEPGRDEKPVSELERDTWIEIVNANGDVLGSGRVLHVEVYDDDDFGRRAMLTYRIPGYVPETLRCAADMAMPLLTEAEVADRLDEERRDLIAAQLEEIADLVRFNAMPLPPVHSPVTVGLTYPDAAGVEALAKTLGLTVKQTTGQIYVSRQVDGDSGAGVELHAVMYIKQLSGLDYTRADDGELPQPAAGRVPSRYEHPRDAEVDEVAPKTRVTTEILPPGALCVGAPEGFDAGCGISGAHGPH